jgi:hypothetical protein
MRLASLHRPWPICQAVFALGVLSAPAWAVGTITLPAAHGGNGLLTLTTTLPKCIVGVAVPPAPAPTAGPCTDTAFISGTLGTTNSVFLPGQFNGTPPPQSYPVIPLAATSALATAFANGPVGGLALAMGPALPVNITVTNFATVVNAASVRAGLTLQASVNYIAPNAPNGTTALPALNQLIWTQITYDNFFAPSTPQNPATLLDSYTNNGGTGGPPPVNPALQTSFNQACIAIPAPNANGTPITIPAGGAGVNGATGETNAYCDPIYPFQSQAGAATFSDTPQGRWSVPASFRAIDFLSSISIVNKVPTLTVYDNAIVYGFDLKIPEPGFKLVLFSMGALLIVVLSRRRSAKS